MTDDVHTPRVALELCDFLVSSDAAEYLNKTEHLTLEQHGAFVVLRDLIEQHGFHEVLDDPEMIRCALGCSLERWHGYMAEHWHDVIAPAVVPVLEAEAGETA